MKMKRKKRSGIVDVPVTSMADIAFLLIIFFILAAQFMKDAKIKLDLPVDAKVSEQEMTQVQVSMDKEGLIYLNGDEVKKEALKAMVTAKIQPNKDKSVFFKADAALQRKVFEPVIIDISDAGGVLVPLGDKQ